MNVLGNTLGNTLGAILGNVLGNSLGNIITFVRSYMQPIKTMNEIYLEEDERLLEEARMCEKSRSNIIFMAS